MLKTKTHHKAPSHSGKKTHKKKPIHSQQKRCNATTTTEMDRAMQIAQGLTKDMRKRVAAEKLKKPTVEERMETSVDLYDNKDLNEINELDLYKYLPMKFDTQEKFMHYYLDKENKAGGGYWLIRENTLKVMNFMDQFTDKVVLPKPRPANLPQRKQIENLALIYGHRGTGKSFTMAQAIHYARIQGWVVVAAGAYDTIHDMDGVIQPSTLPNSDGLYDQMLKARTFLHRMAEVYPDQLKAIPLTKGNEHYAKYGNWDRAEDPRFNAPADNQPDPAMYPFPSPDVIPRPTEKAPGKTLYDLAATGAWRADLATRATVDFLDELRSQTKIPVLVAIDDYNAFKQKSDYINPANLRVRLDANRLTFVRALEQLVQTPPARGCTLVGTSSKFTQFRVEQILESAGQHIFCKSYDQSELQTVLEHYSTSKFILGKMDLEFLRRCQGTTGNMPRLVREFASLQ